MIQTILSTAFPERQPKGNADTARVCHPRSSAPVSVLLSMPRSYGWLNALNVIFRKERGWDGYELLADIVLNHSSANPGPTTIVGSSSESLSESNCLIFEEKEEVEW